MGTVENFDSSFNYISMFQYFYLHSEDLKIGHVAELDDIVGEFMRSRKRMLIYEDSKNMLEDFEGRQYM